MVLHAQSSALFYAPCREGDGTSHGLLYRAAARYSGLSPEALGPLETGRWGKPAFSRVPELHFSLSHSGQWWACALSCAPVGLDLQIHRSFSPPEALSRRFFHPLEDAFLVGEAYRSFFDLWSAKESYVKFTGQGLLLDPSEFSVVSPDGTFPAVPGLSLRLVPFFPGYSLCLCAASPILADPTPL